MKTWKRTLLAAAVLLLGGAGAAWACPVSGSIVCKNDPAVGVSGVNISFTLVSDPNAAANASSGTDGTFSTYLSWVGWYDVNLIAGSPNVECAIDPKTGTGAPIHLDAILVDDPVKCPQPPPPPPPGCTVTPPAGIAFPYCPARPLGTAKAECGLFNLAALGKDDLSGGGRTTTATLTAPVAIVKAGGCYQVFYDVVADETLLTAPFQQGISHVTYCTCK